MLTLLGMRQQLVRSLRGFVRDNWGKQPSRMSIFGSVARGDGTVESDIDLLIVRPARVRTDDETWAEQVHSTADYVEALTGNEVSSLEVSARDIGRMSRSSQNGVAMRC